MRNRKKALSATPSVQQGAPSAQARRRVSLDLTVEADARLEKMRRLANVSSDDELFANALRLYDFFLRLRDEKKEFRVIGPDGSATNIELVF